MTSPGRLADEAVRERALEPATSFIVQAPAGSGKTTVLTQRLLSLLTVVDEPEQILAITFTRKAAAEMHHRISQEIEKRLANPDYKPKWGRIKAVRERFSGANISTIHSFCARLLREFPIEAGVNPNFTELEDHEGVQMKEHAIMETLEEWLEEKTEAPSKGKREAQIEGNLRDNHRKPRNFCFL